MVRVYEHTTGPHLECHEDFKARLTDRINYWKEWSCNACDIILAFCTITSRVGTDVEAAVKEIPGGKPVILVVFHHTFEPDYVVPDSRRFINRQDVLLVNILFHESQGLLRCLQNDEALKKATDCLLSLGAECHSPPAPPFAPGSQSRPSSSRLWIGLLIGAIVLCVIIIVIIEFSRGSQTNGTSHNPSGSIGGSVQGGHEGYEGTNQRIRI